MNLPYSFYVVFNPLLNGENQSYKTQAHEFFHRLKENLASGDSSKSHLYWGKLKMSSHEKPLEFERFKKAHEANKAGGFHTHLVISDFHHYWVAKVESVHQEVFDKENTLPFYDGKDVEIWFKISDMDLISSEYVETGYYLEQLFARSEFSDQEIESINPYLSGLRYPLIVQDRLAEPYFVNSIAGQKPRALGQNPLIENPGEFGKVANNVQTYVLPPAIYGKLSERVRKKLISVEMKIYKQEGGKEELNKEIVRNYREILEEVLNETFCRFAFEEAGRAVFEDKERLSLKELSEIFVNPARVESRNLDLLFKPKLGFFRYCRKELLEILQERDFLLSEEEGEVSQKEAMLFRNIVLGVGCKGIINSLICLYHEDEFMDSYFRKAS